MYGNSGPIDYELAMRDQQQCLWEAERRHLADLAQHGQTPRERLATTLIALALWLAPTMRGEGVQRPALLAQR